MTGAHVENDHNPWDYLYMYAMLSDLQPLRAMHPVQFHRTGMLTYTQDCILESEDSSFLPPHLPVKRCFEIKGDLKLDELIERSNLSISEKLDSLEARTTMRFTQLESDMLSRLNIIIQKLEGRGAGMQRSGSSSNMLSGQQ